MLQLNPSTILFSSRWCVYWYVLFCVLSVLWNWQNCDQNTKLSLRGFPPLILGIYFYVWNIDIIRRSLAMCSWFWVKWHNFFYFIMWLIVWLLTYAFNKINHKSVFNTACTKQCNSVTTLLWAFLNCLILFLLDQS